MITYAMSASNLQDLINEHFSDSDHQMDDNPQTYADVFSLLSADYILHIKPQEPDAPTFLAPLKFKATKTGFQFKKQKTTTIMPLGYHSKLRIENYLHKSIEEIRNFDSLTLFGILGKLYQTPAWQQSNETGAWLTPLEHAQAYIGIVQQSKQ